MEDLPHYPYRVVHPAARMTFLVYDYDYANHRLILLDSTLTDTQGRISIPPIPNGDADGTRLDLVLGVSAKCVPSYEGSENWLGDWIASRYDTYPLVEPFSYRTWTETNIPTGEYTIGDSYTDYFRLTAYGDTAAYLHVVDVARQNFEKFYALNGSNRIGLLWILLSDTAETSRTIRMFADTMHESSLWIEIPAKWGSPATQVYTVPDVWDAQVVSHECGHVFGGRFHFFRDYTDVEAYWESISNGYRAASEGWADWWSGYVHNDPIFRNGYGSPRRYGIWNRENGESGVDSNNVMTWRRTANCMGDKCIGSVAGMLWDLTDYRSTLEDFSGRQDWGSISQTHHPDGKGDTISISPQELVHTLINMDTQKGQRSPQTIGDLLALYFFNSDRSHERGFKDVWYEHGVDYNISCCNDRRGNADGDLRDMADQSDLQAFVDYIFFGMEASMTPCLLEGNTDGIDTPPIIDQSDLQAYIDFVFFNADLVTCSGQFGNYRVIVRDNAGGW